LRNTQQGVISDKERTMVATASIDAIEWLRKQVEAAPDGLRAMLTQMVNLLMNAEVEEVCGAGYGERTADRAWGSGGRCCPPACPRAAPGSRP
jgi:hypothetical protein